MGAAGVVVAQVAGAAPASASNGQPLILGTSNTATGITLLLGPSLQVAGQTIALAGTVDDPDGYAVTGQVSVSGGVGAGVSGMTDSPVGNGVYGINSDGNGVFGRCTNGTGASGVYGQNDSTGYGVAGRAVNGTGVLADSSNGTALSVLGKARTSPGAVARPSRRPRPASRSPWPGPPHPATCC
jgi:hypothetical protein